MDDDLSLDFTDYRVTAPTREQFPPANSAIAQHMYNRHTALCYRASRDAMWFLAARRGGAIVGAALGRWERLRDHDVVHVDQVCNLTSAPRIGGAIMRRLFAHVGPDAIYCIENGGGERAYHCYVRAALAAGLHVYALNRDRDDLQGLDDRRNMLRLFVSNRPLREVALVFFCAHQHVLNP